MIGCFLRSKRDEKHVEMKFSAEESLFNENLRGYGLRHVCNAFCEKTRAVRDELCSPNMSLFWEVKTIGKWVVTGEEGGVKQTICVWLNLPNLILAMLSWTSFHEMLQPE